MKNILEYRAYLIKLVILQWQIEKAAGRDTSKKECLAIVLKELAKQKEIRHV